MAKFCGNCGNSLNDTAIFCGKCGNKIPAAPLSFGMPPSPVSQPPGGFQPVQPAFTPSAPTADFSSYAPVTPAFPPPPAFATPPPLTAPSTADFAEFAPQPAAVVPPPPAGDSSGFAPLPSTFAPPPPAEDFSGFAPLPPSFTPPRPEEDFSGFAPLPSAFTPPPPASGSSGFAPLPAAFTPPLPAADFSGFAPLPPAFTPPSAADPISLAPPPPPSPSSYASAPTAAAPINSTNYAPIGNAAPGSSPNYAPIQGVGGPPPGQMNYAPIPGATPVAGYAPAQPIPFPAKKSNTLLKVVVAFVVILFVGGALALAGLWYAAQQIKAKAHQVAVQALGGGSAKPGGLAGLLGNSESSDESSGGFKGDPCRFLSKAEVSQAAGLPVIRMEAADGGCTYIARGDPADVTAKHMTAMIGGMGADAKSQKMVQQFAGAFFAQQEAGDKSLKAQAATGEVPVLVLSFSAGHAAAEMKLNRGAFNRIGPVSAGGDSVKKTASGDLPGIGDEAFVVGGSAIMLRKGNTMARLMYTGCPCGTDKVIPLARTLASRL